MEYVITTEQPFEGVESRLMEVLRNQGLVVQRTFSLRSAVATSWPGDKTPPPRQDDAPAESGPGYSVLMLYASDAQRYCLGLVTLYQRQGRTVITFVPTVGGDESAAPGALSVPAATLANDVDAELVVALVLNGLDYCVGVEHD